jgi:SAM-dependent methyltransferase
MKEKLIAEIVNIFESLGILKPFELYECNEASLPQWAKQYTENSSYLICCELNLDEKVVLGRCLGKEIYQHKQFSFWFKGVENQTIPIECFSNSIKISSVKAFLPTILYDNHIVLPSWLDDFLFKELNAIYAPDYQRFEYNLDLTKQEIKTYLGTYFPRSYSESFCIFDRLFKNSEYQLTICQKDEISILDFGCGTGGEIIGLLTALEKYFPGIKKINVLAIDGNQDSLRSLTKIVERFSSITAKTINFQLGPISIDNIEDVNIINDIIQNSFDFILSFKAICELISRKRLINNAYEYIAKTLATKLSDCGLMVILDVTIKNESLGTFYPIILNQGIKSFINDTGIYKTLIPLSCYLFEDQCKNQCFSQRKFNVTHSRKSDDISKVSYRIIGRRPLVNSIIPSNLDGRFIVNKKDGRNIYCPLTSGMEERDSYDISN